MAVMFAGILLATGVVARSQSAKPVDLFTEILSAPPTDPPEDSLAVYPSTLDIHGLAAMPDVVRVRIPRRDGDLVASVQLERMDRREGFGERDTWACIHGDVTGCEIIPYPGYPQELFSYTWIGQGDGYDLRLTIHHGHAVGVLVGRAGRFGIEWRQTKELRVEYFLVDDTIANAGSSPAATQSDQPANVPAMSVTDAQRATLARIEPRATRATTIATQPGHARVVHRGGAQASRRQSVGLP
jgi:hypothetical protein